MTLSYTAKKTNGREFKLKGQVYVLSNFNTTQTSPPAEIIHHSSVQSRQKQSLYTGNEILHIIKWQINALKQKMSPILK